MKMGFKPLFLMLAILCAAAALSGCAPKEKGVKCVFCKMIVSLPENAQGAKIIYRDGHEEFFCVLGHAMKGWEIETGPEGNKENPPEKFLVVDFDKKALIEARKAFFVFGSDVPAKMFTKSAVAFGSRADADAFAKEHGGEVMDFGQISKVDLMVPKTGMPGKMHGK